MELLAAKCTPTPTPKWSRSASGKVPSTSPGVRNTSFLPPDVPPELLDVRGKLFQWTFNCGGTAGDSVHLQQQLLMNLIMNSVDARKEC